MLLQEPNYENSNENENFGRTTMQLPNLTPREENIHKILLKFMDDNGQGGCPAFSPDFLLKKVKPILKNVGIRRVGKNTFEGVLKKSPVILFDEQITGTATRTAIVTYKFEPNNEHDFVSGFIGGHEISVNKEHTLYSVVLGENETLPIHIKYAGIVDWKLTISQIKLSDTYELELVNIEGSDLSVSNNNYIRANGINGNFEHKFQTTPKLA